jgi:ribosomal protein S18 acetylase RimI-like enzyme
MNPIRTDHIIRGATPGDAQALADLKLTTFRETFLEDFGVPYPPADLALFEAETYAITRVEAELADPAHCTWDGADGTLIAYAHAGPCKLPHGEATPVDWELYQLYVRRAGQGGGLGKRLMAHVLFWLAEHGGPVWLGVWSGNARALALYRQLGFAVVGEYQFRVGTWLDDELIMRRPDQLACPGHAGPSDAMRP